MELYSDRRICHRSSLLIYFVRLCASRSETKLREPSVSDSHAFGEHWFSQTVRYWESVGYALLGVKSPWDSSAV